ncbi:MAG: S8 family serine peptidase [Synergistaceae bacterium]|jgi:subtilisin family serine protease|nr:S8 family serine peptidase [Synergistaceae bacterium]
MKISARTLLALAVLVLVPQMVFAQPAYRSGEVLVVLKNNIGQISASSLNSSAVSGYVKEVADTVGSRVSKTYAALSKHSGDVFALLRSDTKTTEELIMELQDNPDIISVSPNYIIKALATPNDPDYNRLWGLGKINADSAWDVTRGDANSYVAVVDSGVWAEHPDLDANIDRALSRNFTNGNSEVTNHGDFGDDNGHGTHVSGIVGAVGDNLIGVTGVNWRTKIIMLKVLDKNGYGDTSWELDAINYIIELVQSGKRIPVANFSLGGAMEINSADEYIGSPEWMAFKALDRLNNTVIVVAAGNDAVEVGAPSSIPMDLDDDGIDETTIIGMSFPASLIGINNMVVVGSIARDNSSSVFSNWSSRYVHVAAPGGDSTKGEESLIYSTVPKSRAPSGYAYMQGTSMAAPYVAGSVALLASAPAFSTLDASQLKSHLLSTATQSVNPERPGGSAAQNAPDSKLSIYGLINVNDAIKRAPGSIEVSSIELRAPASIMEAKKILPMAAYVLPETATDKSVKWSSLDEKIATVDARGRVTAVSGGKTSIIATAQDGSNVQSQPYQIEIAKREASSSSRGCSVTYGISALLIAAFALSHARAAKCRRASRQTVSDRSIY